MIIRQTTIEESQRVNELFAIAFETPLTNCPADPGNERIHHWAAFTDDGKEMMSNLTISDFQIQFDGHCCKMGGIGGVATLPQYRRMGGIRGCFEMALPDMYDKGYDFSYLYPFSTAYYRKFGYECCVQKYSVTLQLDLLKPLPVSGTFRLAEKHRPMTDAIRSIDTKLEKTYNMMVQHGESDYQWAENTDPAPKQEFTYVYFTAENIPIAYTTFRMQMQSDGRNLVCSRFRFTDKEGYNGLLHLFKSLASDHRYVKFAIPAIPAMQYLMPEWSLGAASWSVLPAGMVRVIHVENVLKKARYIGSGTITLWIRDEQIPENNGPFTVTFQDGQAVSVTREERKADATLTIPAFSALICGVSDFSDAALWMNGLEVHNPSAPFGQVFYRKNMMIADYF